LPIATHGAALGHGRADGVPARHRAHYWSWDKPFVLLTVVFGYLCFYMYAVSGSAGCSSVAQARWERRRTSG
jgi:hypothetical protein